MSKARKLLNEISTNKLDLWKAREIAGILDTYKDDLYKYDIYNSVDAIKKVFKDNAADIKYPLRNKLKIEIPQAIVLANEVLIQLQKLYDQRASGYAGRH